MAVTIVTRAGKGSPLSHTEMDTNFTNLKTEADKLNGVTPGTASASQAVVLDASKEVDDITLGSTSVLDDGVTATTQSAYDNSTKVATTAYVDSVGVIQRVDATPYVTFVTTNDVIPHDDSVPQITEGKLIISQAFTPKLATSRVVVTISTDVISCNTSGYAILALFKVGTSDALDASSTYIGGAAITVSPVLIHDFLPGSTDAITITLRIGTQAAGSIIYINGTNATRIFGGKSAVKMSIVEFAV